MGVNFGVSSAWFLIKLDHRTVLFFLLNSDMGRTKTAVHNSKQGNAMHVS